MLNQFFNPKSIALVGASSNTGKLGYRILKNLVDGGYKGALYPINPKADTILNLKGYKSINDLPEGPELVLVVIPSDIVCDVAKRCGERGVKGLIVISAGFKEAGKEGKEKEEQLKEIVKRYNMRLIGPNCLGIIDTVSSLNASFAFEMPPRGKISFITQSGALGTAVLDWAVKEEIGLSKFVSFGNMADVSETDLIKEFGDDPDTNVILLYLEGLKDGKKFIETARQVSMKKPIVMVKSGRSSAGSKAVSSHTGSLAGSDRAYDAALRQAGVIRANSVQELFDCAIAFAYQPPITGKRIAIVTNAGGPGVMAVDAVEDSSMTMSEISLEAKQELKTFLSPAASVNNPVDVLGDALADTYGKAMEIVLKEKKTDAVLAVLTPQVVTQIPETAEKAASIYKKYKKPVFGCFMGGHRMDEGIKVLMKRGIPNYLFPERAVSSMKSMYDYYTWQTTDRGNLANFKVEKQAVEKMIGEAKKEGRKTMGDIEGRSILDCYGINTVKSLVAKGVEECKPIISKTGLPVVMKLVSPDILHKTEAGGVKVGINSLEDAEKAFRDILRSARAYKKDAKIEGVQLQPMVSGGVEVIVGVMKDAQFGHLLMFGLGGIYVELLKDVSFRVVPVSDMDAKGMVNGIKTVKMLKGFRNIPERDTDAIVDVLLRVSQLCSDFPEISEMDINPLMVMEKGKGAIAVDARFAL
ncbi:MAG TPA: acetate--CoA ligase family protein [bacterium]|nr:acetate--CoA ligase family protein [bacterium]